MIQVSLIGLLTLNHRFCYLRSYVNNSDRALVLIKLTYCNVNKMDGKKVTNNYDNNNDKYNDNALCFIYSWRSIPMEGGDNRQDR